MSHGTPLAAWQGKMYRAQLGGGHWTSHPPHNGLCRCPRVEVVSHALAPDDERPLLATGVELWGGERLSPWPYPYYWQWVLFAPGATGPVTDRCWYGTKHQALAAALAYVHDGELVTAPKYQP